MINILVWDSVRLKICYFLQLRYTAYAFNVYTKYYREVCLMRCNVLRIPVRMMAPCSWGIPPFETNSTEHFLTHSLSKPLDDEDEEEDANSDLDRNTFMNGNLDLNFSLRKKNCEHKSN